MNQPLRVNVYRGKQLESQHQVLVSVVDCDGKELQSFGNSGFPVFLRSAAKPFQALAFLHSGAARACDASSQEIALACASHLGHDIHVQTVQGLLQRCQIDAQALQNCEHEHSHELAFDCQQKNKDEKKLFQHNCSGKHAAFLVAQKHLQLPLQNYLLPQAPLQKMVLKAVSDLAQMSLENLETSVEADGCGAPIFKMPLHNVARLYAELGAQKHPIYAAYLQTLFQAMNSHPELIRGEGDFNTDLIRAFSGRLVAKLGYEGVYGVALANGVGLAVKVLDGNARALAPAIMHILSGLFSMQDSAILSLKKWATPRVHNIHKVVVGHIAVESLDGVCE